MARTFSGPVPVPSPQTSALRVLVTGASRGIGFELVKQYAGAHKDNIVIAGVRDPNGKSSQAVQALAKQTPNVHVVKIDVDDEQQIRDSAAEVSRWTDGTLDVLINNAGIVGDENDPLKVTTKQLLEVVNTNVAGPLAVIQTHLPLLRKSTVGGKVINISSGVGSSAHLMMMGHPLLPYGMSKAALTYMNTSFAHTVKDVMFLALSPGWVSTGEYAIWCSNDQHSS